MTCSNTRKTSMPSWSRRPTTCTLPLPWRPWILANMCTSRSRSAGRSRKLENFRGAQKKPKSPRRWATRDTPQTMDGPPSSMCGLGPSATCARYISGPTGRWAFGPRACRARSCRRRGPNLFAGVVGTSTHGLPQPFAATTPFLPDWHGICFLARPPQTWTTTPSITPSTGAAGPTGA